MFTFPIPLWGRMCVIYPTVWWGTLGTHLRVCECVFGEDAVWFQRHWPMKNESMWRVWGEKGASLSLSPSRASFFTRLPSCAPSQTRTSPPPPAPTSSSNLPLDLSPLSVPSPQPILSVLHWKGERMLSPHKSQSLLVLQEQGSCHWEAPASLTQKAE